MLVALRVNVLLKGHSGIRSSTLKTYIDALNLNLIPFVPEQGTVGASGDLAPLSHIALCYIGEGIIWNPKSEKFEEPSKAVLEANGIEPIQLKAKEGLSLINGTQFIASLGAEAVVRCSQLIEQANVIAALSVDAQMGSFVAFDERIHKVRPHIGQNFVAEQMRSLFHSDANAIGQKSEINESHRKCSRVQDAYSLRCIPQVHGIVYDTLNFAKQILTTELNSATDNPMVFGEDVISGGNFHGEYPAKVCDYLCIAIAELGIISERRIARLIDNTLNSHLPNFLVKEGGLNSGFMMAQVTAAALVSENKVLVHPGSSDSIPTSCNKEDHVSMGGMSSRKLLQVADHIETILAIEWLCAAQAIEFLRPLKSTDVLEKVYAILREQVKPLDHDRVLSIDINISKALLHSGALLGLTK